MIRLPAPRRVELAALITVLVTLVAAPTPGDIGGCGQKAESLDPGVFFASKAVLDCQRCQDCDLAFQSCSKACNESDLPATFPDNCYPLVHDGEVCLRALNNASCDDYLGYMDDSNPSAPSECNFCPAR